MNCLKVLNIMTLNKAIEHKKEKRKPYYRAKSISKQCRNNGSCNWCRENRLFKNKKRKLIYSE